MNLQYWTWEPAAAREKLKAPSVKHLCDVLFENPTHAHRFAKLLTYFKQRKTLRLRDLPTEELPKATWHRYLSYAEQLGIVKKEHGVYELTNRFSTPLKTLAEFYSKWYKEGGVEDLTYLYPKESGVSRANTDSTAVAPEGTSTQ